MSMTIFSRETELNAVFAVQVAWLLLLQNRLFIIEFWLGRQVLLPEHAITPCMPVPGVWLYPIQASHLPPVIGLAVDAVRFTGVVLVGELVVAVAAFVKRRAWSVGVPARPHHQRAARVPPAVAVQHDRAEVDLEARRE